MPVVASETGETFAGDTNELYQLIKAHIISTNTDVNQAKAEIMELRSGLSALSESSPDRDEVTARVVAIEVGLGQAQDKLTEVGRRMSTMTGDSPQGNRTRETSRNQSP